MPQSRKSQRLPQQSPEQRLASLKARLSHILRIKSIVSSDGWPEVEATMEAEVKRRRIARDSLNWNDDAGKFLAWKEKASFMTGFIQGMEFMLNMTRSIPQEELEVQEAIKKLEEAMKGTRTRRE